MLESYLISATLGYKNYHFLFYRRENEAQREKWFYLPTHQQQEAGVGSQSLSAGPLVDGIPNLLLTLDT